MGWNVKLPITCHAVGYMSKTKFASTVFDYISDILMAHPEVVWVNVQFLRVQLT